MNSKKQVSSVRVRTDVGFCVFSKKLIIYIEKNVEKIIMFSSKEK
jgi:hypothetical protein